jgi:hypothetical protein
MIEREQGKIYGLTFGFDDGENKVFAYSTMFELVYERFEEVSNLEISQMGGTTFIAIFNAKDERELKSIFDANNEEKRRRLLALEHILHTL